MNDRDAGFQPTPIPFKAVLYYEYLGRNDSFREIWWPFVCNSCIKACDLQRCKSKIIHVERIMVKYRFIFTCYRNKRDTMQEFRTSNEMCRQTESMF